MRVRVGRGGGVFFFFFLFMKKKRWVLVIHGKKPNFFI